MTPPIVHERTLQASCEATFAAWTTPDSLAVWMCPGELQRAEVELDLRVGGRFRIEMIGEQRYVQHGEFLAIEPPKRLELRWVSECMPEGEQQTRLSVSFESTPDRGTRLRLVHDRLPEGDAYAGHDAGWASILDKLDRALAPAR